jgi:hypothetical protein
VEANDDNTTTEEKKSSAQTHLPNGLIELDEWQIDRKLACFLFHTFFALKTNEQLH